MKYIYLGKIVNTHGIKGEIRILSRFDKKNQVFLPGFKVYMGPSKEEQIIRTYRKHKNFDMITFKGINDINEVLIYKGNPIYIKRDDLKLTENDYLIDDLIGMKVIFNKEYYGIVNNIYDNNGNILLAIEYLKDYYIPIKGNYIKEVDTKNKVILVENIKDLIL